MLQDREHLEIEHSLLPDHVFLHACPSTWFVLNWTPSATNWKRI